MITYVTGNLFDSPAQVLVNTVNTVGVMGRGLALKFKKIYPEMFAEYRDLCDKNLLEIGNLHLYKTHNKWVLNFPTKKHWRSPSRPEYIEAGLQKFVQIYADAGIDSIAFPMLGCGNGELEWDEQVRPLMEHHLAPLPIQCFIYTGQIVRNHPEHRVPEETIKWLRSEPEALPFNAVWEDIKDQIAKNPRFQTLEERAPFEVAVRIEPDALIVKASTRIYSLEYEDLTDVWQQLRRHGFAYRGMLPARLRTTYLLPIFARLPYVTVVRLQERQPANTPGRSRAAIQLIPPSRERDDQGPLFTPVFE